MGDAEDYDRKNFIILILFSSIFMIIYMTYLSLVVKYIIKNYHRKKLCVFWVEYSLLILNGIIFIMIYIINSIYIHIYKDNSRIDNPTNLSKSSISISIIVFLTSMCVTIICCLLFDSIIAIQLSLKMEKMKKINDKDLTAVSEKIKNVNLNNILKMKYTYKYYFLFSLIIILYIVLCILAYRDTNIKRFDGIWNLYGYFTYLLRYYHLIVLILLIGSISFMNQSKKSLLNKNYHNDNRIGQKVYDIYFSQLVYFTDILSFKLVSDLIMNIPAIFFLSEEKFNTFTLIFSEFSIFLYIFLGGSENLILDKDCKAGKMDTKLRYMFCLKKLDFHFGEKDHRIIFDEFQFNYSPEEQSLFSDLNLTIIKNVEYNLMDIEEGKNLNESGMDDSILGIETFYHNFDESNKKKIDFKTVSEFYLLQKLIMLFFNNNLDVYESAMDNIDENFFLSIKKLGKNRKNKKQNLFLKDSMISNRQSRLSINEIKNIKTSLRISPNEVFSSIEEKEIFNELKKKLNLKNEKYSYKIESLVSSELFELFPFYQMKINSIIKSINPTANIKIFNKFVKRNNNSQNNFIIRNENNRISIKNDIAYENNNNNVESTQNISVKEIEKNLFYTYDLYLMYEIYDKKDFVNSNELKNVISEYNKYFLSTIKNMNYSFLPLILGIFSVEIYGSEKIIVLYRNPLFFSNFNHFNHWINFYITEEPEKIRVSSLFNDIIDVNQIEIENSLKVNEDDYDEIKKTLENDYNFLKKIKNFFPIIHLFFGDENKDDVSEENEKGAEIKMNKNKYHFIENSILGESSINNDIGLIDVLDKNLSLSNYNNPDDSNDINNIINENSLFDKQYYFMSGKEIRTIKIYFTNLFRKDCELNKSKKISIINSESYCEFLQAQLIKYLIKNPLFNEENNENEENIDEENKEGKKIEKKEN